MAESTSRPFPPESDGQRVFEQDAIRITDGVEPGRRGTDEVDVPSGNATPPMTDVDYLDRALVDAEQLVAYAAEVGIEVDRTHRDAVLNARSARAGGWSPEMAAKLLSALTRIAAALKPVTAETLKACEQKELVDGAIRGYRWVAIVLAAIIVPFSFASFVTSAISDAIRKDIAVANEVAVKLTTQLASATASTHGATSGGGSPGRPAQPDRCHGAPAVCCNDSGD
jgi:hypothetical protein